ncbi:hypothetical protein EV212_1226 [Frisingicoccus caecimuris]|uniref:Alpha/beta hydrolase n=2 Tax=Frisingicoccus caecimuris TaxID=1796636 RepID=A0A4R2L568_9FIRM|nr:hypothetical protein EV212_1226 [Frisingicoccus caecimuris]
MKTTKFYIGKIPVIIWGAKSDKVYIYVHGKMSDKESAETFAQIAENKGYQTISFDLPEHGERKDENYRCDIWNGISDLHQISAYTFANWKSVSLFACSLGAYFSLQAYKDITFEKCFFLSPIVNMEYLIKNMFLWFHITEEMLYTKKEIPTPIDTLSWDYYQYVKKNPVTRWNNPTYILYGCKDNLQSLQIIENFAKSNSVSLTISKYSEHSFMGNGDDEVIKSWICDNL